MSSAGISNATRRFRFRKGLDLSIEGRPAQEVDGEKRVRTVAASADDAPGLRLEALVEPGARVRLGEPLARDRARSRLVLAAPGTGVVRAVHRGRRRALQSIEVELEGDEELELDPVPRERLAELPRAAVVERLCASGEWTALRERPFGRVPDPDDAPHALLVTAIESDPLAPDPAVPIAARARELEAGLAVLGRLTDGPLHLCVRPGAALPTGDPARVSIAEFEGPHPAGLPGTHAHFLAPVGRARRVWCVGWSDAIAIGHLFTAGRILVERTIALGGPRVRRPRLVRTRRGASVDDLLEGELEPGECRAIAGSVLSGRRASGWAAHLGREHRAVCALAAPEEPGRLAAFFGRSIVRARARDTALHGRPGAFFPTGAFERVLPLALPATPLLRALAAGDVEQAEELGCLELVEEDLALCSYVCPGKLDYGSLLRAVLDRIAEDA